MAHYMNSSWQPMRKLTVFLIVLPLVLMVRVAPGESSAPVNPVALLESMAAYLQSLDSFLLHTEKVFDDVLSDGAKVQFAGAATLSLRRPDGIHIDYGDDLSAKELWYDGKTVTLLDHLKKVYMQVEAAPPIPNALMQLENDYGLFLPLASLLRGNASQDFQEDASKRRYLGLHDVDGIACHHVLFVGDAVDWQLWIDADGDPLLRKMVVTYKEIEGAPQHATVVTEFVANPPLEDALFAAQLPSGSVRAEPIKIEGRKQ